jgi:phosphonate utilization associated putative membrane protein
VTWPIVGAVLFAALLHASWNALIKSGQDKAIDTALIHILGCGVGVVLVAMFGLPRREAWPWLAASMTIHIGYYITLVGAYRHGELGFTYPIMRGTAPLLVAMLSGQLIGEHLSLAAWLGVAGISSGVLLIGDPLQRPRWLAPRPRLRPHQRPAIIAAYTLVDGLGVRASGNALQYVALLFMLDGLPYFMIVMWQRRAAFADSVAFMKQRWPLALVGSSASLGAYGIALWAMTKAPVASVAALRETSVLFATLIGVLMLKERFRLQRLLGAGAVVVGVMALRLA